jgi:hypothetical protein
MQLTKMGFVFMFDRVTGEPIWPIQERSVPPSDVPGEEAWPTQPVPVRPPSIAPQGVSIDDAFDLTPELKGEAVAEMKKYRHWPAVYAAQPAGNTDAAGDHRRRKLGRRRIRSGYGHSLHKDQRHCIARAGAEARAARVDPVVTLKYE